MRLKKMKKMFAERYVRHFLVSFLVILTITSLPRLWTRSIVYAEDTSSSSSTSVSEGAHKLIQLTPPSITSGGNSLTVKGRLVFYPPGSSDPEPIKRAWVEVKDNEWRVRPDEVVASGYTDYNGYFSFSGINNDDGWLEDGRDIYIEVFAENWAADVVDNPGWVYLGLADPTYHANNKDDTRNDVDDNTIIDFGTLTPENPGAYNILNTVLTGWSFLSAQQGISAPQVKVFFKDWFTPARSYYYGGILPDPFDIRGLHIQDDDQDQWHEDTILHEYGHFVMDEYADFWTPFSDVEHSYESPSGRFPLETAWVEGWAHFFSAAARHWAGYPVAEYRDDPPIETPNYQGDSLEAAVAGILWDMYDPMGSALTEPDDTLSLGFAPVWDVLVNYDPQPGYGDDTSAFLSYPITELNGWTIGAGGMVYGYENLWPIGKDHPWNIYDFWDGFLTRYPSWKTDLWRIFDLHGVRIPDNVPPNNPTMYDSSHTVGVPSWGERIRIIVGGAYDDLSGVEGLSVLWDNSPLTLPPETMNYPDGVMISAIISPTLSEGLEWYFHLRTVDYAGNWAPDALHAGPFYVQIETVDDDTTGPTLSNPASYYSERARARYATLVDVRVSIDVTDPSGISDVKFRAYFDGFWTDWYPFTGSSGNTYWIDLHYLRGRWYLYYGWDLYFGWYFYSFAGPEPYLGQTIYWQVLAFDDDNEGWEDTARTQSPLYSTQLIEPPTRIGIFPEVDISIEPSSSVVEVGGFTTYKLFISNIGYINDTYSLTLQGLDPNWFSFSTNPIEVEPGQTESVTLTVTPPYAYMALTEYVFTVTATSLADPSVFDTTDAVISVVGPILIITADSPVNILVTAPNGLRVGYDPETGTTINEIPGATYSGPGSEPQVVQIPNSLAGHYSIDIFGTGTGTYTITLESLASDASTIDTVTWTGTTEPGQHDTQTVKVEPDGTIADITPPTTEITLTGTLGLNDWYISDVVVTLTATDHISGVALTQYSFDGATWITYTGQFTINVEGTTTIYYNSTDNNGNVEETKSTSMKIDTTLPTTILTIGSPKHTDIAGNIYVTSGTSLTLSATDNPEGSGVASTAYKIRNATYDTGWITYTTPFYLTGLDGTYFIDYNSTDYAGNVEPTNTATVILDNTPPTTTITIGEPKYIETIDTYVTSATPFTLTATDNAGSGVASTAYKIYNATFDTGWTTYIGAFNLPNWLTDGTYNIAYNSTDNLENIEVTKIITVILDNAPPTTSLTIGDPQCVLDGDIYVNSATPFTLDATDNEGSGVALTVYKIYNSTYDSGWITYTGNFSLPTWLNNGPYFIAYNSTDNLGNVEAENIVVVILRNPLVDTWVTDSDFNEIESFRAVFTPYRNTELYKLTATNPGQFYFNILVNNTWPEPQNLTVVYSIDANFTLKGARPIHVYADLDRTIDITDNCTFTDNTITIYNVAPNATAYVTIHLDYALKGTMWTAEEVEAWYSEHGFSTTVHPITSEVVITDPELQIPPVPLTLIFLMGVLPAILLCLGILIALLKYVILPTKKRK